MEAADCHIAWVNVSAYLDNSLGDFEDHHDIQAKKRKPTVEEFGSQTAKEKKNH